MKLSRSALAHYIDANMGKSTADWFLVGKDIEDMSVDLSPDITVIKNILGETSVKDNGNQPQLNADPYYANPDDAIYEPLLDICMNRRKGDECKTKILEVLIEDTEATQHRAWVEDVLIKPNSYGGNTEGVAIPFGIYFDGNRKEVKVTIDKDTKVPTIVV